MVVRQKCLSEYIDLGTSHHGVGWFEDNGWNFNQGMQDFKIRDYRIKDC